MTEQADLVLKGGRIIDPESGLDEIQDIDQHQDAEGIPAICGHLRVRIDRCLLRTHDIVDLAQAFSP